MISRKTTVRLNTLSVLLIAYLLIVHTWLVVLIEKRNEMDIVDHSYLFHSSTIDIVPMLASYMMHNQYITSY